MRVDFGGPCRPTEFDAAVVRNARGTREPAKILTIPLLPTPQRGGGSPGSWFFFEHGVGHPLSHPLGHLSPSNPATHKLTSEFEVLYNC